MKVLIVDDEKTLVNMIKEILSHDKIDCDAAYDGQEAINYATTGQYDLIVLDVMMPKRDGLEVLKEIRKNKGSRLDKGILSKHFQQDLI